MKWKGEPSGTTNVSVAIQGPKQLGEVLPHFLSVHFCKEQPEHSLLLLPSKIRDVDLVALYVSPETQRVE